MIFDHYKIRCKLFSVYSQLLLYSDYKLAAYLTDITSTTLAGNPAQRIEYTARQDQVDLKFIQIVTIKDGKEYIITFGSPIGQFQNDVPAVQKMIDSFQIISTNPTKTTTSSTASNKNVNNNHAPVALGQTVGTSYRYLLV